MGTTLKIGGPSSRGAGSSDALAIHSDESLARRVGEGDERAFEHLYARYRTRLQRYCASILRQPEDAEEALQSAMLRAYLSLAARGRRDVAVRPWLYRIAHNQCVDMLRRRPAQAPSAFTGDEVHNAPSVPERVQIADDLRTLRQDLLALPIEQRGALVLRELSGLSHAQIGAVLEESTSGVKQLIYQARVGLHAMADGRDLDCDTVRRRISDGDGRVLRARGLGAHLRECTACSGFREATAAGPARLAALAPMVPLAIGQRVLEAIRSILAGGGAGGGAGAIGSGASGGAVGVTAGAKLAAVVVAAIVGGSAIVAPVVIAETASPPRPVRLAGAAPSGVVVHSGPTAGTGPPAAAAPGAPVLVEPSMPIEIGSIVVAEYDQAAAVPAMPVVPAPAKAASGAGPVPGVAEQVSPAVAPGASAAPQTGATPATSGSAGRRSPGGSPAGRPGPRRGDSPGSVGPPGSGHGPAQGQGANAPATSTPSGPPPSAPRGPLRADGPSPAASASPAPAEAATPDPAPADPPAHGRGAHPAPGGPPAGGPPAHGPRRP